MTMRLSEEILPMEGLRLMSHPSSLPPYKFNTKIASNNLKDCLKNPFSKRERRKPSQFSKLGRRQVPSEKEEN